MGHRDLLFCDPTYRTATDADSWHALASAAQRLRPNLYFTYPIKEDVKKKVFSSPLAGDIDVWLASSRVSLLEGLLIFPLWLAAISSGEANPSCLSQLTGFMKRWRSTPFGSRGYASY